MIKHQSAEPGSELAKARVQAHAAFDTKWKSGAMSRSNAYSWLARQMGLPKHECHMLQFSIEQCERVIAICIADDFEVIE